METSQPASGMADARLTPPASPAVSAAQSAQAAAIDAQVNLEQILLKQFDFASQSAQAVRQDSSQMIYFYWVMFGVLAAGLGFILQLGAGGRAPGQVAGLAAYSQVLMLVALVGAGVVHLAFYSRWLRLRRRYNDCFAFMTGISTFYVQRFERDVPEIGALLAWQPESAAARQPLSAYVVSVYSLLPLLSGVFFGAAVVVGGEMWLGVNGGALFPIPINATLLGAAGGVVVLALALVILAGRMAGSRRASRTPVLGDI